MTLTTDVPGDHPDWLTVVLAFAGSVALLWGAHAAAPVNVTLTVDGEPRVVTTRAGTVGALLRLHGLDVQSGDIVRPPVGTRLTTGDRVEVHRGRRVRLRVDGVVHRLRSHARTPRGILDAAQVTLGPEDTISVDGTSWTLDRALDLRNPTAARHRDRPVVGAVEDPPDGSAVKIAHGGRTDSRREVSAASVAVPRMARVAPTLDTAPLTIDVVRARRLEVVEAGLPLTVRTAGLTIGDALQRAGIHLWPEDVLHPPQDAPLGTVRRVAIHRATPFQVITEDGPDAVRARAATVGEALARIGRALKGRDYSVPAAEAPLRPGMAVEIVRVVEDTLVQEREIPFATETQPDPDLPLDERRVVREGRPGMKTQRIKITYENGEEVGREVVAETQTREPVAQIVAYGTRIVWRTVDTPEGAKRYWRKMRVYATSYSAARAGTPTWVPWYGLTRLGWKMRHGIVAVDPNFIPLRTNLFVQGYGVGVAGDTGGGIKRYHIDLGFDDDNYQSWHQWVDVYLLEPLPPDDEIRWILP